MNHAARQLRRIFVRLLPRKPLSSSQGLLLFVFAMVLVTLMRPHSRLPVDDEEVQLLAMGQGRTLRSSSGTKSDVVLRGDSSSAFLPNPPTQKHALFILDPTPAGAAPSAQLRLLEPHLQPLHAYSEAITLSTLSGPAATSLAARFLLPASNLPAVVYVAPLWDTGGGLKRAAAFVPSQHKEGYTGFLPWLKSKARLSLLLANDWDNHTDMCFYFVAPDNQEQLLGCPQVQQEVWQEVSLLDRFVARNQSTGALLAEHLALFSGIFAVHSPHFCNYMVDRKCEMERLPYPTDPVILERRVQGDKYRVQLMKDQPSRTPHFDTLGFVKKRCSQELFQALSGYLNASWDSLVLERKAVDSIYSNHFDAPGLQATLPESGWLKPRLFSIVQAELEQWIGRRRRRVTLDSTAMYGIRVYTTGSTLAMHCDRGDTHVVSAIINVAQNVEQPWPLQIKEHSGKQHDVFMQPGDMVMYEGAACAHGRVMPLKGRYFANVFIHFKPKVSTSIRSAHAAAGKSSRSTSAAARRWGTTKA